jgi:hypothetical protein
LIEVFRVIPRKLAALLTVSALAFPLAVIAQPHASSSSQATVAELITGLRGKAKALEGTAGMRLGFQSLNSRFKLPSDAVRYSDFVLVRLLFEATRDAGFWNLHWTITDREPESDNIWRQWLTVRTPSYTAPTASAECDELSALYAFLARSMGIKGVGLFWPASNHTVAVWEIRPASRSAVRVVVPTSQIFLGEADFFGTGKFDPWSQRVIYEYTRRDVPTSFAIPRPLLSFFLGQAERYGGATDSTLQRLRYLREAVFLKRLSPEQAAIEAGRQGRAAGSPEDVAAFASFAQEMRSP